MDDPTIQFDIPDPGGKRLTMWQEEQTLTALERAQDATGWIFHWNNPNVLLELQSLAQGLVDAGHRHYSIKGLFEVLRFKHAIKTTGKPYKLNNNLTPFYARLLMEFEPRLVGFFHTRRSQK